MRALVPLLLLAACSPSEPPLLIDPADTRQSALPAAPKPVVDSEGRVAIRSVRDAVRAEVQRLYTLQCDKTDVPDRAFEPVEITGGGPPEYAVILPRGTCTFDGNITGNQWLGTGGGVVQIWYATGGPPRMLLEHSMHGFSVRPRGLLSLQHGGFCPGGAGPGTCLVQYEWNDRDLVLEPVHRRLYDDDHPGTPPTMNYDYEAVSRSSALRHAERRGTDEFSRHSKPERHPGPKFQEFSKNEFR